MMSELAKRVRLKSHADLRGNISVLELVQASKDDPVLPFAPKRIYILHDHERPQDRGAHAHKLLRQVIFAMSGHVKIIVDNGKTHESFDLSSPDEALILEPVLWRDIIVSAGAVVAVLASDVYDETDYIRNYDEFLTYVRSSGT